MDGFVFVKSGHHFFKLPVSDILFIKAERKYVKVVTHAATHLVRGTISALEQNLNPVEFCRIHKSYIVAFKHIAGLDTKTVYAAGRKLPIGRRYKEVLFKNISLLSNLLIQPGTYGSNLNQAIA